MKTKIKAVFLMVVLVLMMVFMTTMCCGAADSVSQKKSEAVIDYLIKNGCVSTEWIFEGDHTKDAPAEMKGYIKLNKTAVAYIIVGVGGSYNCGNKHCTMWIVLKTRQGYRTIYNDMADYIKVLKTSHHGFADLQCESVTLFESYRNLQVYDGTQYHSVKQWVVKFKK